MKGVIIIPKYLEKLWTPKKNDSNFNSIVSENVHLYYEIKKAFGFELRFADEVDVDKDTDVVCVFSVPYHNRPKLIPGILELDKSIKLFLFPGDVQCYNDSSGLECYRNKLKVFNRSDKIFSFSNEYFMEMYPEFVDKYIILPKSFAPIDRFKQFELNESPINKCLLSGSTHATVYPIRTSIIKKKHFLIDYRNVIYTGDKYARLLHSYFCCITCASIYKYALAKSFEIPATGSLLITEETKDLTALGFIPDIHYIPFTSSNVFNVVTECIKNHKDYTEIRKTGMNFVRKNHSINNRIELLKNIFGEII